MTYILLLTIIIAVASQHVFQKHYSIKADGNSPGLFLLITVLSTLLFFVVSSGFKLEFKSGLILYSLGFGAVYAMGILGAFFAIWYGSFALTTLIISYSSIVPTIFGLVFLDESLSIFAILGIVFLMISLFLINAKGENAKFSVKWIISVALAFIGNGMCSAVQRLQQIKFNGEFKSEFMIEALALVVLALVIYEAFAKDDIKSSLKNCIIYGVPKGIANGITNLLVMTVTPFIALSTLFASISAGGVVTTFILSKLFYKEKLTRLQNVGFVFGVAAIVLLNL